MYTAFYGLFEKPFSLSPDPRYLFFASAHREALAHLRYGIEQGEGFIAITGEVGTGKSTLCRALLAGLDPETEVAFLFNPPRSATELLQAIAQEYGLEPAGHQRHALNNQLNHFLLDRKRQGRRVLLIIDEAQNLDVHVLEEIRLLSNLETASSKLIQIVLLGQPELDRKLDSSELRQLRQRISVRWFLTPLSRLETTAYVAHRLQVAAGGGREIFTRGALREIFRCSGGVPRRINLLADRSLLAGYAAEVPRIGRSIVRRASREIAGEQARGAGRGRVAALRAAGAVGAAALFAIAGLLGNWAGHSGALRGLYAGDRSATLQLAAVSAPGQSPREPETAQASPARAEAARAANLDLLRGIKTLAPGPVGSRGDRLRNTLAPGSFLGRLLDHQAEFVAREVSLSAILDIFARSGFAELPADDDAIVTLFEARGLSVLRVDDSSLDSLRALNHPAILSLYSERGQRRTIGLGSLEGERALLYGVAGREALEVSVNELENQWRGEALVVWETLEEIPRVLSLGQEGESVVWLQLALGELGLYTGTASGLFDDSTQRSVRSLQADALIEADGNVGPRTQMVLYSKLPRYRVPRLIQRPGAG